MSASTDFVINMNSAEDANKVVSIMKNIAAQRTPDYPTEIEKFIADITVEGSTVKVEDSYSLMSPTFREMGFQIMTEIGRHNFGAFTMQAWFTSYNCGYEAEFSGRAFKNGKYRISFSEHE